LIVLGFVQKNGGDMLQSDEYKALLKEYEDCDQRRIAFQMKASKLLDAGDIDGAVAEFRLATTESDTSVVIFGKMVMASEKKKE